MNRDIIKKLICIPLNQVIQVCCNCIDSKYRLKHDYFKAFLFMWISEPVEDISAQKLNLL